ncbi:MAG: CopD family protein [Gammaproteobacteria bacterium]
MLVLLYKFLHLTAAFAWFAGLLYLPRLFVYHAGCDDDAGRARFCRMESRLYWRIMLPAMVAVLVFGLMLVATAPRGGWIFIKMALAFALVLYHLYCGFVIRAFARGQTPHSARFFRFFNELPALLLVALVFVAVYKPMMG